MTQHVAMASNGRLVIPANVRSELGMQDGGKFIVHVEDGQIRLEPIPGCCRPRPGHCAPLCPRGVSLVDELSEERRLEVERE